MRNIAITGASSGMGAALAKRYAGPGVALALIARNGEKLQQTARTAEAAGAKVHVYAVDVRDQPAIRTALMAFDANHPIDLLIANAGIFDGRQQGEDIEALETSMRVIETNLSGALNTVYAVLPAMRSRKKGQIAIVSSLAGLTPLAGALGYSASKSALVGFGLGLKQAVYKDGIGVSVICPGFVETPITVRHIGWQPFRMTADKAAEKIAHGIARNKAIVAFPLPLHLIARPSVIVPEFVRRFAGNLFACRAASPAVESRQATPIRLAGE